MVALTLWVVEHFYAVWIGKAGNWFPGGFSRVLGWVVGIRRV
jgi:hypothetical protein